MIRTFFVFGVGDPDQWILNGSANPLKNCPIHTWIGSGLVEANPDTKILIHGHNLHGLQLQWMTKNGLLIPPIML